MFKKFKYKNDRSLKVNNWKNTNIYGNIHKSSVNHLKI